MGNCITGRGKSILVACVNIGAKKKQRRIITSRFMQKTDFGIQKTINLLQRKGEMYFKGTEMNRSIKGTENTPQNPSYHFYQKETIPALE